MLLLLLMLLLFLMMPTLELASAVPCLPVFWSREGARPVGRAVYLSMSLTESCLLEISTYPSTVVSVPLCPALISLYSQDARLPSSPVTYAPVRWPTPALREAVIFSLGG